MIEYVEILKIWSKCPGKMGTIPGQVISIKRVNDISILGNARETLEKQRWQMKLRESLVRKMQNDIMPVYF